MISPRERISAVVMATMYYFGDKSFDVCEGIRSLDRLGMTILSSDWLRIGIEELDGDYCG